MRGGHHPVPASGVCSPQPQWRSPGHPLLGDGIIPATRLHVRIAWILPHPTVIAPTGLAPSPPTSAARVVTPRGSAAVPCAFFFAARRYHGYGTGDSCARWRALTHPHTFSLSLGTAASQPRVAHTFVH
ncbi:hypothetical protein C8J57DRAFT_1732785 [Mycena rebaudengoi]|nr:hypothetical protein C8J57DRAFT_1732785 [Mycena rebaudengoi]